MSITPIEHPLPGERVLALAPADATEAADAARWWLRRPNLFPGRTLTGPTLSGRQDWATAHVALRARAFTPGVVRGLETALVEAAAGLAACRLALMQGIGLAASGEDLRLPQAHELGLAQLPVVADPSVFAGLGGAGGAGEGAGGALAGKIVGPALGEVVAAQPDALPRVGILLLQPVSAERVGAFDPTDPCPLDGCGSSRVAAFEDWRIGDGARLLWYAWPEEWRTLPPLPPSGPAHWRNLLAWRIFDAERTLGADATLPWEAWGVALGLVACDAAWTPLFLDRASVVRSGGRARWPRMGGGADGLGTHWRLPALWQAQLEQLAEQLSEQLTAAGDPPPTGAELGAGFVRLPPFGLLPAHVLDLETLRCDFFPAGFELDAAPLPLEQLDAALAEAASLAPLELALGERLRLLVPVPQAVFEPRLLLREVIDAEFARTLAAFELARARWLGARQGLRTRAAVLARAIAGKAVAVPAIADDAAALEAESLAPWGPPPAGGGHRSALVAGIHQHIFEAATATLALAASDELFAWVYLDPDRPPRSLMLQWHAGDWEHRAFWGEDLIPWGAPDSPAHARIGELPPAGRWVELRVPATALGLAGRAVDGMAFTLFDGQAAWGLNGRASPDGTTQKWFCSVLPEAARPGGDEPWTFLSHNDLWAPFERLDGVLPVDGSGAPAGGGHAATAGEDGGGGASGGATGGGATGGGATAGGAAGSIARRAAEGVREYGFGGASATLQAGAGEALFAWVWLDPNAPPSAVLLEWRGAQGVRQAFWGLDRIPAADQAGLVRRRVGALPRPGRWTRLTVAVDGDDGLQAAGLVLNGMRFAVAGGGAAFGASGALGAVGSAGTPGAERVWFAGALPAGAQAEGNWRFLSARELHAPTSAGRNGQVQAALALYDDVALAPLSAHERYQLFARGLEGFIAFLKARTDRVDDLVDFNFVKVQTDIYRVRQLILGSSAATRLAVSPALAGIAQAETAVASTERIAGFFDELKAETPPAGTAPRSGGTSVRAGLSATSLAGGTSIGAVGTAGTLGTTSSPTTSALRLDLAAPLQPGLATGATLAQPTAELAPRLDLAAGDSTLFVRSTTEPRFTLAATTAFLPSDITNAAPLVGKAEVRTVSIAERLQAPKATEAKDYTTATRYEAVRALAAYAGTLTAEDGGEVPGLFAELAIHGVRGDPALFYASAAELEEGVPLPAVDSDDTAEQAALDARPRSLAFTRFLREPWRMPLLLRAPQRIRVDEATQFADGTDLADNTVVLMRQLEGRIRLYRNAIAAAQRVLDAVRASAQALDARLRAVDEELAEARHDVAVTRALIAEEDARLAAINARRARILREQVHFIAYQRPREAELIAAAPSRPLDPGLVTPAVPACLAAHEDAPDALRELFAVVREAPARWFAAAPALLDRLDRVDLLVKTIQSAQLRSQVLSLKLAAQPVVAAPQGVAGAIAALQGKQLQAVQQLRSAATRIDPAAFTQLGWQGVRGEADKVVSLGDLIDGEHGKGAVAGRAAALFDELARVAACLHAGFSAVLPSIRLDWAERLSQFDIAPRLRNLAGLARWGEIDYTERHRLQAFVDWLFGQLKAGEVEAENLMNDVVRMCLLLASHAPINRILSGRLPQPATAVPGLRLPIRVTDPLQLRVGMQALIYQADRVVVRATVEDIGGDTAAARVLQVEGRQLQLAAESRVHFVDAASLAAGPAASPVATSAVRLPGSTPR